MSSEPVAPASPRPPRPLPASSRRERVAVALVLGLALGVYLASPVRRFLDPRYTALTAESLATRGSWDLAPYFATSGRASGSASGPSSADVEEEGAVPGAPDSGDARRRGGRPARVARGAWQVERAGERLLLWYPPGTPLLSAPIVGALRLAGLSAVGSDGRFRAAGENRQHAVVAALVAAATAALVLRLARRELPLGASFGVALATAFGSSLWSVASRALWSHAWSALVVGAAWLELLRWEDGERRRPLLLGALLAAGFWVRPTDALVALGVAGFVAWRHRPALAALCAAGAAGLAGFVALSWRLWGSWLPPYYRLSVDAGADGFLGRLAGLLLSPTRGLLAFTPVLALVAVALARHGVPRPRRAPLALAASLLAAHLALYAAWRLWWGGATFGPRLLTDLVPILAWVAALAVRAAGEATPTPAGRPAALRAAAGRALLAGLLLWGFVAHGAGALSARAVRVVRAADRPERLWDWRRSPPLALLGARPEDEPARPRPTAAPEG